MNTLTTKNTQESSSTTAVAEVETDEIRAVTAADEKNTEEYIQTMSKLIKAMIEITLLQRNVNMTIKEGLPKLQEALNVHQRLKKKKKIERRAEETQRFRCFRCLDYGHHARDCKGTDRSKMCYKCGQTGHLAANCDNEPHCALCAEMTVKLDEQKHILGSTKCRTLKLALEKRKLQLENGRRN